MQTIVCEPFCELSPPRVRTWTGSKLGLQSLQTIVCELLPQGFDPGLVPTLGCKVCKLEFANFLPQGARPNPKIWRPTMSFWSKNQLFGHFWLRALSRLVNKTEPARIKNLAAQSALWFLVKKRTISLNFGLRALFSRLGEKVILLQSPIGGRDSPTRVRPWTRSQLWLQRLQTKVCELSPKRGSTLDGFQLWAAFQASKVSKFQAPKVPRMK